MHGVYILKSAFVLEFTQSVYVTFSVFWKGEPVACAFDFDKALLVSSYEYYKYQKGIRETIRVAFETAENIKAKLDLIRELGFMGIAFDIMQIPCEYLLMFDELYKIPERHPEM